MPWRRPQQIDPNRLIGAIDETYYSPGACSLSPHIALREADLDFEAIQVDLGTKVTKAGADFRKVNPKGAVPALEIDGGQVLTEGAAIVQYIADKKPGSKLARRRTTERYRLQEWLNYIASEIHKGFSPLFNPKAPDEWKAMVKDMLAGNSIICRNSSTANPT